MEIKSVFEINSIKWVTNIEGFIVGLLPMGIREAFKGGYLKGAPWHDSRGPCGARLAMRSGNSRGENHI